jgi:hypothetical protein
MCKTTWPDYFDIYKTYIALKQWMLKTAYDQPTLVEGFFHNVK